MNSPCWVTEEAHATRRAPDTALDAGLASWIGPAALFGVGFTTGFAFVVMWNQEVFCEHPTTGFTLTIAFIAVGFIAGPSVFGVLATGVDPSVALLTAATPAVLAPLALRSREGGLDRSSVPS